MDSYVIANPAGATWLFGVLLTCIVFLLGIIGWFGRRLIADLTSAIKDLRHALQIDRTDIGLLKDRMTKQEVTCQIQRGEACSPKRPKIAMDQPPEKSTLS